MLLAIPTMLLHHVRACEQVVNGPLVIPKDKEHVGEGVERYYVEQGVDPSAHHHIAAEACILSGLEGDYADIKESLAYGLPVPGQQHHLDYRDPHTH